MPNNDDRSENHRNQDPETATIRQATGDGIPPLDGHHPGTATIPWPAVVVSAGQDNDKPSRDPENLIALGRRGAEAYEPDLCSVSSMVSPADFEMTLQTQAVLRVFLDHPLQEHYGLEISKAAGLPSGSLYPILAKLEGAGWVTSDWEQVDPHAVGRPRRRYYRLTPDGAEMAEQALAATLERLSPQPGRRVRLPSHGFGPVRRPGWGVGR